MTPQHKTSHAIIDWHSIEETLYVDGYPTIAIIGDPPRNVTLPHHGEVPDAEIVHNTIPIFSYTPEAWEIHPNGDIELSYHTAAGHTDILKIKSDAYRRAHAINPMSNELSEAKIMDYSDMRFTIGPANKRKEKFKNNYKP